MKRPKFITQRQIRGSIIALGGTSYRLVRIYLKWPSDYSSWELAHDGGLLCHDLDKQVARVLRKGRKRYLVITHWRLQHGHNGAIHVFSELRRVGCVGGADRWLRIPHNFPHVPAASSAIRVNNPWQQKRRRIADPHATVSSSEITAIDTEELFLDDGEVKL